MDDPIAQVYAAPLAEFTRVRNEVAESLRRQERDEEARRVAALRKPVLSVWAVDQLARRERDAVTALLEATTEVQDATDQATLREASEKRQNLVARLVEAAAAILDEAGHSATASTRQDIARTLYSATSEEERDALARGVLREPISASGFAGELSVTGKTTSAQPETQRRKRDLERLRNELTDAEHDAARKRQESERAKRAAAAAEAEAVAADRRVQRLRDRLERLQA